MPNTTDSTELRPVSEETFSRFCRLLYERRLVSGVGGNVAARTGEHFAFLSPSGFSLRTVKPGLLSVVRLSGELVSGPQPTKDAELHLKVLRARSDVHVVFHVHGAHIVAATTMIEPGADTIPPLTPGFVYFAYPLPMLPYYTPGSDELSETVASALSTPGQKAVLLQNHGLVTAGKDFEEAFNVAEEVEEAARVFVLTGGKSKPIPSHKIEEIRSAHS